MMTKVRNSCDIKPTFAYSAESRTKCISGVFDSGATEHIFQDATKPVDVRKSTVTIETASKAALICMKEVLMCALLENGLIALTVFSSLTR